MSKKKENKDTGSTIALNKRAAIKDRDWQRDKQRVMRRSNRDA